MTHRPVGGMPRTVPIVIVWRLPKAMQMYMQITAMVVEIVMLAPFL